MRINKCWYLYCHKGFISVGTIYGAIKIPTGISSVGQAKEWVKNQYVGNLNRYVTDREPLPVDVEAEAIRAAKANDQAAE